MSAPVTPFITPMTFDPGDWSPVNGVPNFGFGVIDIFNSATFHEFQLQPVFPRKLLYFAVTNNQATSVDVSFTLNDGQNIFKWQYPRTLNGVRTVKAPSFPIFWCSPGMTTDTANASTLNRAMSSNSLNVTMPKSANRFTIYAHPLQFVTSASSIKIQPDYPTPTFTPAAGGDGNYNWLVLWKLIEFPLGVKLHTKLYR